MFYVYLILNLINGTLYVGKSCKPIARFNKHINVAININKSIGARNQAYPIHHAINKYGVDNFIFKIVEELNNENDSLLLEIKWISFLKENGYILYNITDGGDNPPHTLGEDNHKSILNNQEVMEIKFLLFKGRSQSVIAKQFNVSRNTIASISNNDNWSHLDISSEFLKYLENKYLDCDFAQEKHLIRSQSLLGKEPWNKGKTNCQIFYKKYTVEQELEIYNDFLQTGKYKVTAKKFNCSDSTVKKFVNKCIKSDA